LINNPKIVISLLPAVIGFLPVAGGALMSAPLVDSEADKLGLKPAKKAYVNFWFRHTIFPVYPLSQVLILAAALSNVTVTSIIIRQIPVVITMVVAGYFIGFSKTPKTKKEEAHTNANESRSNLRGFFVSFSPILITIIVAVGLDAVDPELSKLGYDALIAILVGLALILAITRPSLHVSTRPFKTWGIYGITAAAYGAFLLKSMLIATGIPDLFTSFAANGTIDTTLLLVVIPAALGMLTASALGGISISIPILGGIIALSPRTASLIYMSAYLGYVMSPTHLCLTFTADHFKCTLDKIYKYAIPSFLATFATTLLIYFLV
jgi:integral membrane protein (TIGR00529 family)